MFAETDAFSGFAVDDLDRAREFYGSTLGIRTSAIHPGLLTLHLAGGRDTLIYEKADHEPANYTILNFRVDDVDAALDGLRDRGIEPERYPGMEQDEGGVFRAGGPDIAWFTDPAGNVLAVISREPTG